MRFNKVIKLNAVMTQFGKVGHFPHISMQILLRDGEFDITEVAGLSLGQRRLVILTELTRRQPVPPGEC
jgi:hypothetical protein